MTGYLNPLTLSFILLLSAAFVVIYQHRHLFSALYYRWRLKSVVEGIDDTGEPKTQHVCPICGNDMEKGFLVSLRRISWSRNVPPYNLGMASPLTDFLNEPLAPRNIPYTGGASILRASRCMRCGIININLNQQDYDTA